MIWCPTLQKRLLMGVFSNTEELLVRFQADITGDF